MKRIFRFRAKPVMPSQICKVFAEREIRKNYVEGIFCCGRKPNLFITKVYKNGKPVQ